MLIKRSLRRVSTVMALAILAVFAARMITRTASPSFAEADFIVNIPQQTLPRNYLNVSVESEAGTHCRLTFVPPSGEPRIMDTTADENGLCKWRWKLDEGVGRGHARLIFTINGVSDTHFIEIRPEF